jgi:hypothetical protein
VSLCTAFPAAAQDEFSRVIEVELHPVRRAQIAVWIERADGTYMQTIGITQAVAYYGIGNRPGASQMNSGFSWPYGRREGVLPVWGHRRAAAQGLFGRVIFQDRTSEGWASRSSNDHSRDDHFCLSFNQSASEMDALDAVTCPSIFNSDKGRYLRDTDVAAGYSEPFETAPGSGMMRPLGIGSIYPPRRDVTRCADASCFDHEDVARYQADARSVMPEIDAVTMATPPERQLRMMFTVPAEWENGEYAVFVEVNTEGDYNSAWSPAQYPTPLAPESTWDFWAMQYGYPYRGQPSVVYRLPLTISNGAFDATARDPIGYGALDGTDGELREMDGSITDDATGAPGSGADRLMLTEQAYRVRVRLIGPEVCNENVAPGGIEGFAITEFTDRRHAHRFAHLTFVAPPDDFGIARYDVRVSREPIVDDLSFDRALQARAATIENEALVITPVQAGETIQADLGGLSPEQTFYIAVRAVDTCNEHGPMAVIEYTSPAIEFTTVSPCFVATAAYGTPMADDVAVLRRLRDRHLRTNAAGRALVSIYETVGPAMADVIREDEDRRAAARTVLAPIVTIARWLDR